MTGALPCVGPTHQRSCLWPGSVPPFPVTRSPLRCRGVACFQAQGAGTFYAMAQRGTWNLTFRTAGATRLPARDGRGRPYMFLEPVEELPKVHRRFIGREQLGGSDGQVIRNVLQPSPDVLKNQTPRTASPPPIRVLPVRFKLFPCCCQLPWVAQSPRGVEAACPQAASLAVGERVRAVYWRRQSPAQTRSAKDGDEWVIIATRHRSDSLSRSNRERSPCRRSGEPARTTRCTRVKRPESVTAVSPNEGITPRL